MLARDNPFQSARIESVSYRFPDGVSCATLIERLHASGNRGALIGPQGSGKTTLLEELHKQAPGLGYHSFLLRAEPGRFGFPLLEQLGERDFLLIDSAERLNWLEWRRLKWVTRRAGALVITSHRPGLLPTLFECRTTQALFSEIVRELIPMKDFDRCVSDLGQVFTEHQGNIRGALRALYDRLANDSAETFLPKSAPL